jgi:uncharacterized membrane protein (DUF4010 family)
MQSSVPPVPEGYEPWKALAEALLIGLLIGAQRESSKSNPKGGVREFVLVAVTGAVCGLLNSPPLAIACLFVVTALWIMHQWQTQDPALTTGFALAATYVLAFLASVPNFAQGEPIAVGLAVVTVGLLEYKQQLRTFFRETLTDKEFIDTVRFIAMVLVIYPALPAGRFGPYDFFEPRKVWVFVILVSSISYAGYFLEKFVGGKWSLRLTAVLGGIASTTAATTAFAKNSKDAPEKSVAYWQAAAIANAIQFPRVLALIFAISAPLAQALAWPLLAAAATGLLIGCAVRPNVNAGPSDVPLRNPFSLRSALRFGLVFAAITLLVRAVAANFGAGALLTTAGIAGLVDVDSIVVSTSELLSLNQVNSTTAGYAIFLALAANAVFKAGIALSGGSPVFGLRVAASLAAMIATGAFLFATLA